MGRVIELREYVRGEADTFLPVEGNTRTTDNVSWVVRARPESESLAHLQTRYAREPGDLDGASSS